MADDKSNKGYVAKWPFKRPKLKGGGGAALTIQKGEIKYIDARGLVDDPGDLYGDEFAVEIASITDQCKEELESKDIKLKWYRMEITQLTEGGIAIVLYGEEE